MNATHYYWKTLYKMLYTVQHQDAKLYSMLGFSASIVSLLALPIFPLLLIITVPLIGYFFYSYFKNKNNLPSCIQGIVLEKEHWYKPGPKLTDYDPESIDFEHHLYCIRLSIKNSYLLSEKGLVVYKNLRQAQTIWVNCLGFEFLSNGGSYYFVFSPTNDLLGFIDSEGKGITNGKPISNESLKWHSFSIAQHIFYPPSSEYIRIQ